jgi:hypothetical protein
MDIDYTIVTAWFDVREKENHALKDIDENGHYCVPDHYFRSAALLFEKEFPMIIFTEERYRDRVLSLRPQNMLDKTLVIIKDYPDLYRWDLYDQFLENHNRNHIRNLHTEKFTALYKFIINQKVEFVKEAIELNPFSSSKFGWMDMRLHCVYDMPVTETTEIFNNIPSDRVLITQCSYTHQNEISSRRDFYEWTRGKVAAGVFLGHKESILTFCELCRQELVISIEEGLSPTDEMIYSSVIARNNNLFEPHVGDYCDVLRNISYNRGSTHLTINFLNRSFQEGNHYFTYKIAENLRKGILKDEIHPSIEQIYNVWYYNYVSNFWLGNREYCRSILLELYELSFRIEALKSHIQGLKGFLLSMIDYLHDEEINEKFRDL